MNRPMADRLENLDEEKKLMILELAENTQVVDMVVALRQHGIMTSAPTLTRFIRRNQEKRLLEEGVESKDRVDALARRSKEWKLREGTLEAVRQRMYERALGSKNPEESMDLYRAMVKEEAQLREQELEARKVAVAEEQVRLQRMKIETEKAKARVPAEVIASEPIAETAAESKQLQAPPTSEGEKQALELLQDLSQILNRAGDVEEKVLEARERLAVGMKCLVSRPGPEAA